MIEQMELRHQKVLSALAAIPRSSMHSSTDPLRGSSFLYSPPGSRQLPCGLRQALCSGVRVPHETIVTMMLTMVVLTERCHNTKCVLGTSIIQHNFLLNAVPALIEVVFTP